MWNDVNKELPTQDGQPTYDYVLVSDGKSKYSIARYVDDNTDGKGTMVAKWDFLAGNYESGQAAYAGDITDEMTVDEIKWWMQFPSTPNKVEEQNMLDVKNWMYSFTRTDN